MKQKEYLKYLLFNDAISTHKMGMSHNAMDRSCIWEGFQKQIWSKLFDELYKTAKIKYLKNREEFTSNPECWEEIPYKNGKKMTEKEWGAIKMGENVETKLELVKTGGYWKSLEKIDEYVNEIIERWIKNVDV